MRMDFRAPTLRAASETATSAPSSPTTALSSTATIFPSLVTTATSSSTIRVRRREEKLGPLEEMAPPGDPYYSNINLFTPTPSGLPSTASSAPPPIRSPSLRAICRSEWTENGRHYFEYDMGSTRINDFFSFLSGRYSVRRDEHEDVKLEIYYQPGHEYDLDRMLDRRSPASIITIRITAHISSSNSASSNFRAIARLRSPFPTPSPIPKPSASSNE